MATTVKQGVEYEISAKNKSKPDVDEAVRYAKNANKEVEESSKKAGAEAAAAFSPLKTVMAALSGNVAALTQQLGAFLDKMKLVSISVGALTGITAVVTAIGAAWHYVGEKIEEAKRRQEEFARQDFTAGLEKLAKAQDDLAKMSEAAVGAIEKESAETQRLINHEKDLAKAELELARARELAAAKAEDREAINARYDREAQQIERDRREAKLKERAGKAESMITRREFDVGYAEDLAEQARKTRDEARNAYNDWMKKQRAKYREDYAYKHGGIGMMPELGQNSAYDKEASIYAVEQIGKDEEARKTMADLARRQKEAEKAFAKAEQTVDRYKRKLDDARKAAGEVFDAINLEIANNKTEDAKTDLSDQLRKEKAEKAAETEAKAKADAELREQERLDAEEQRMLAAQLAEEQRMEREAAQREAAERRAIFRAELADRRADLAATTEDRSDAVARLTAAQNQSARAWGWYRNQDSLAAQLDEERASAEAEKNFQRQFERLKSHRPDWRKADDYGSGSMRALSLEDTAVRRVALAREEERAAERELQGVNQRLDTLNGMIAELVRSAEEG